MSTYETPTDELRQVLVEETETNGYDGGPNWTVVKHRYYRVQRKWMVESGPREWTYGVSEPHIPMREEWQDLPIVTEAEARRKTPST